jgi:hypothetical protein
LTADGRGSGYALLPQVRDFFCFDNEVGKFRSLLILKPGKTYFPWQLYPSDSHSQQRYYPSKSARNWFKPQELMASPEAAREASN